MPEIRLCTKLNEFEDLHDRLSTARKGYVSVDAVALEHLLIDHSVMTKALNGSSSFTLIEPRERTKLKG